MSKKLELELETKIVMTAVKNILANNLQIGIDDLLPTTALFKIKKKIIEELPEYISVFKNGERIGDIRLRWGNVQNIIISYSSGLERTIKAALDIQVFYTD